MKFTRVIAFSAIATAVSLAAAQAQNLRNASPPAEFPPASYTGKQYVDSRGCIYIRAGIDGNVTWVPRVSRARKQVCGYQPTAVAGASATPAKPSGPAPVEITVPAAAPKAKPLPEAVKATPAPAPAKPRTVAAPRRTVPAPAPIIVRRPAPAPVPAPTTAPRRAAPVIAPRTPAPATGGPCANASAFSQQYINKGPGVRCGPQAEPPVTYGRGWDRQSALRPRGQGGTLSITSVSPDTRVVPRHVYDRNRNSNNFPVPEGYRPVWSDDRLNPHRAERTLRPAQIRSVATVPPGYRRVVRDDNRLNPNRGPRTAAGDAQTDRIWTRTVPRTLVQPPTDRPVVTVPREVAKSPAETQRRLRLSTRSAPGASGAPVTASAPQRYVRVATYDSDGDARQTAQALARSGLPMRLGTAVRRGTATHRVVLAGPFASQEQAHAALEQVRAAGFPGARLTP